MEDKGCTYARGEEAQSAPTQSRNSSKVQPLHHVFRTRTTMPDSTARSNALPPCGSAAFACIVRESQGNRLSEPLLPLLGTEMADAC